MNQIQMKQILNRLHGLPKDRQERVLWETLGGIGYWIERNPQTRIRQAYTVLESCVAQAETDTASAALSAS